MPLRKLLFLELHWKRRILIGNWRRSTTRITMTATSERDNTHQRAGPSEQGFIPKMHELSGYVANRTVEGGYHRPRLIPAEKVDQRAEAASLRLTRHCKLINRAVLVSTDVPRSRRDLLHRHLLRGAIYACWRCGG